MPDHLVPVALLDDYQDVGRALGPWHELSGVEAISFPDHLVDDDELVRRLEPFEVVVAMRERTPLGRARLERLPRLRLIVTTGMANAAIDLAAARDLGVTVCGTGYSETSTVELTWALILAAARHVPAEDRAVRDGGWQHTLGTELAGKTLAILGLGNIGRKVAAIGQALGMEAIAWSQNLDPELARALGVEPVTREQLFARADVLSIHLRLSDRTRKLVGAAELEAMRPTALLVNTSRGPIVDDRALVAALEAGRLGGAALDVYDVEPLSPDHPLLSAPRTVLTPHIGYVSREQYERWWKEVVEDVAAFLSGAPIRVLAAP